ncbi:hypothetical protein EDC01DRAFT_627526 [Geopyxis carbonaria]|nr:hypothetical protein EDC01DRAFT_627526 [Geopyxis carbonaria]
MPFRAPKPNDMWVDRFYETDPHTKGDQFDYAYHPYNGIGRRISPHSYHHRGKVANLPPPVSPNEHRQSVISVAIGNLNKILSELNRDGKHDQELWSPAQVQHWIATTISYAHCYEIVIQLVIASKEKNKWADLRRVWAKAIEEASEKGTVKKIDTSQQVRPVISQDNVIGMEVSSVYQAIVPIVGRSTKDISLPKATINDAPKDLKQNGTNLVPDTGLKVTEMGLPLRPQGVTTAKEHETDIAQQASEVRFPKKNHPRKKKARNPKEPHNSGGVKADSTVNDTTVEVIEPKELLGSTEDQKELVQKVAQQNVSYKKPQRARTTRAPKEPPTTATTDLTPNVKMGETKLNETHVGAKVEVKIPAANLTTAGHPNELAKEIGEKVVVSRVDKPEGSKTRQPWWNNRRKRGPQQNQKADSELQKPKEVEVKVFIPKNEIESKVSCTNASKVVTKEAIVFQETGPKATIEKEPAVVKADGPKKVDEAVVPGTKAPAVNPRKFYGGNRAWKKNQGIFNPNQPKDAMVKGPSTSLQSYPTAGQGNRQNLPRLNGSGSPATGPNNIQINESKVTRVFPETTVSQSERVEHTYANSGRFPRQGENSSAPFQRQRGFRPRNQMTVHNTVLNVVEQNASKANVVEAKATSVSDSRLAQGNRPRVPYRSRQPKVTDVKESKDLHTVYVKKPEATTEDVSKVIVKDARISDTQRPSFPHKQQFNHKKNATDAQKPAQGVQNPADPKISNATEGKGVPGNLPGNPGPNHPRQNNPRFNIGPQREVLQLRQNQIVPASINEINFPKLGESVERKKTLIWVDQTQPKLSETKVAEAKVVEAEVKVVEEKLPKTSKRKGRKYVNITGQFRI